MSDSELCRVQVAGADEPSGPQAAPERAAPERTATQPVPPPPLTRRTVLATIIGAATGATARRPSAPSRPPAPKPPTRKRGTPLGSPTTSLAGAHAASGSAAVFVQHGDRTRSAIALTFHGSGDPALTGSALDEFARLGVVVTVFAVGQWLAEHPGLAATIAARGHELANHTYTHPALADVGRSTVAEEITRCREQLRAEVGTPTRWFRPSGTPTATTLILEEAARAGYATVVGYDVDPLDYQDPGFGPIVAATLATVQRGSIISLHLGHAQTIAALEVIVTGLRLRGLMPVTLRALLNP